MVVLFSLSVATEQHGEGMELTTVLLVTAGFAALRAPVLCSPVAWSDDAPTDGRHQLRLSQDPPFE